MSPSFSTPPFCHVCGETKFLDRRVLWPGLIAEWNLSPAEAAFIDRQQGTTCAGCGCNLRSIALALALLRTFDRQDTLENWSGSPDYRGLNILEINPAGHLTPWLSRSGSHRLVEYPEYDMTELPFPDGGFDLVLHSDTLEHVPDPVQGLKECRRILAPGGCCLFTIPLIPGRLTRSRSGLPPSYHGTAEDRRDDYLVHTEFGADAWLWPVRAGFRSCTLHCLENPSAFALACGS